MSSVAIHPPKTPVTKGSNSVSAATIPNVCKMPGAPFTPTPLPNIGRSAIRPKGYSKTVKVEKKTVAIKGASFDSIGDLASKGTGGGIVSQNCEGPTKFIAPGSLTVKFDGGNVHLLSDIMSNNNGPSGSPPNAATLMGTVHAPLLSFDQTKELLCVVMCECKAEAEAKKYETLVDPVAFDEPDFGADAERPPGKAMKQACVERKINEDYSNTNLIPEQSYDMSTSPPTPVPGKPKGSRRPDVIRVKNPSKPATGNNIDVFEMKFPPDRIGPGQIKDYKTIGGGKKPTVLTPKNCGC